VAHPDGPVGGTILLTDQTPMTSASAFDLSGVRTVPGKLHRSWSPRQRQIFDELQELFLAEGFRHLTIADLVERLHCSRRTLYSLAPSREELVLIVIDRLLNKMGVEANARAAECDDPGDALAAYLDAGVTTLRPARPAFTQDLEAYGPTRHLYDRHLRTALGVLGNLVNAGIAQGTFRHFHPPLVAEILDSAVDRIRRPEVLERAGVTMSQALAELSELMRHGLVGPPAGGGDGAAEARPAARRKRA
jgi:AcrR family transcriptional regulator